MNRYKIRDRLRKVKLPLPTVLTALVCAMVTRARSLRTVEQRTAQMARKLGSWLGVKRRIADNTFGKVLPRLRLSNLVSCLHRLVKAEHRRGNLKPTRLPVGTIAIDGKNVATLRWHDLCRVLQLEQSEATFAQVKALLAERHPEAQLCQPEHGEPYALMRVHTVTLISSSAAVCVHQRPIPGHTNENGAMPDLLKELKDAYGRTLLFELLTTDAGSHLARRRDPDHRRRLGLLRPEQVCARRASRRGHACAGQAAQGAGPCELQRHAERANRHLPRMVL